MIQLSFHPCRQIQRPISNATNVRRALQGFICLCAIRCPPPVGLFW